MAAHAASIPDHLVEGLRFKLSNTANYVTNRRSVTFWPISASSYTPNGVKVIKIKITADQWLDPHSVTHVFTL